MWQEFKETGDADLRARLIESYLPLVRYTAERLKGKLPQCVDIQEMISAGWIGLINAVDKFDPDRGILFETYCSMRIRGAILDDLRSSDWVPRLIRSKAHKLEKAKLALAFELGRKCLHRLPAASKHIAAIDVVPTVRAHDAQKAIVAFLFLRGVCPRQSADDQFPILHLTEYLDLGLAHLEHTRVSTHRHAL